ncbi:putative Lysyl-tRNA synthetase [Pilobolus umbonatus]|nr:putative Lysyl-tRNA synthetase [Pilobolus umbonatus]
MLTHSVYRLLASSKRLAPVFYQRCSKHTLIQQVNQSQRQLKYPRFALSPERHGKWVTVKELEQYNHIDKGKKVEGALLTLTGRIISKRESSSKLVFYDIVQNGEVMQVVASRARYSGTADQFQEDNRDLCRGDVVSFTGIPGKTNHGQLSLFVTTEMRVLSPCLHEIPTAGLKDPEKRFRQRYLDLLVNPESAQILRTRAKIIKFIRSFLDERGFLEVETPILSGKAGGANARPFSTHAHALDMDMQLRIAPELYLKQLVIGGLDRVYEIGKQFRNEGIDADHNPEFTTCEFYQAYGNLESLMNDTETMLSELSQNICGDTPIKTKNGDIIDFKKPFKRIDVMDRLSKGLNSPLSFLDKEDALSQLEELSHQHNIRISGPATLGRLLDKLISVFIEPECIQPTFLYNHPLALSPLAKETINENGLNVTARFELFVGGKELVNAYEELNDPVEQRRRFELQTNDRNKGDIESPVADTDFCDALEYGLPPTAGWGMGIDRVVQLLVNGSHIREVLTFPVMRTLPPVDK